MIEYAALIMFLFMIILALLQQNIRASDKDSTQVLRDAICNLQTENSLLDRRLHLEGKQMEALGKETGYSRLRAWYFEEVLKQHKIKYKQNPTVEDYQSVLEQNQASETDQSDEA